MNSYVPSRFLVKQRGDDIILVAHGHEFEMTDSEAWKVLCRLRDLFIDTDNLAHHINRRAWASLRKAHIGAAHATAILKGRYAPPPLETDS